MNIEPKLYDQTNYSQRNDSKLIIEQLKKDYGQNKVELLIDVGCGSGNITQDIAQSINCDRILGIDLSDKMIEYAERTYSNDKIHFTVADACDKWDKISKSIDVVEGQADIVTSIYCLHWVSNQKRAMDNIYRMLKPGGKCYILIFSWSHLLPVQEQITFHPRWADFFKHLESDKIKVQKIDGIELREREKSSAPFSVFECPSEQERCEQWSKICRSANLEPISVKIHDSVFYYDNVDSFKGELKALCHYLPLIPENKRDQFMDDYFEHMDKHFISIQGHLPRVRIEHQVLIAISRKKE
ncbi:juvenile hormone acid O-methyltransferase-like [Brevipalpus obovatus]|uniref:juvenile hormone acid O-methyltransferase-like n=1 Tax=Brevipalpus obovatus TaxID=246614 RepID=UPI003D9ED5A9